jgi:DNA-binding CsgD family transcriptional regulator
MARRRSARSPQGSPDPARPPRGLVVDQLSVDGEELLVFEWSSEPPAPPAGLSAAEADVLARLARGQSNAEIAKARETSARTVANQVASLLRKTGAASRFELIRRYAGTRP